jgi:glyoxylase-like metal-dependent hydrolase (beta-lactamase superfamily II)/rhodanese-related sulfurtransferase
MEIKQFEDKNLAHYSYAIVSDGEMALVDPARDPQPYYEFAKRKGAKITTVIETHPHADFVSSHLEIHKAGATIFASKLLGAEYPHRPFDEGDEIRLGRVVLRALNTPGHSPDSISIVALDEKNKPVAVFTGDTLFIGDCGRPDLRETAGAILAARTELAKQMYHSLRSKLMTLPDDVLVYPAHGAGSLCGKELSEQNRSTIGAEKISNWSLQNMSEEDFVDELLKDQPFIPKYFPFEVGINKAGADNYEESVSQALKNISVAGPGMEKEPDPALSIIDSRPQAKFRQAHLQKAINLPNDLNFETWLGSIVNPGERFYLIAENETELKTLIRRIAKIGYEKQIEKAWIGDLGNKKAEFFDSRELRDHPGNFTIIDVRNGLEVKAKTVFANALHIPLHELRERTNEIPLGKPIVVHCAGGYRSAAGASIIKANLNGDAQVYDLGEAIKTFQ